MATTTHRRTTGSLLLPTNTRNYRNTTSPTNTTTTNSSQPIVDMAKLRAAELSTFPCNICQQQRRPTQIKVRRSDISLQYGAPVGMLILNINYCADNDTCAELARNDNDIIKRYITKPAIQPQGVHDEGNATISS